jgi:hypothetical protein
MPREQKPPKPSSEKLSASLSDSNRYHRQDIFYAYSCYNTEMADLPVLRKALSDSACGVVRSAAISIGKLGPPAAEAINDLVLAAGKSDHGLPQAYSYCLNALVRVGTPAEQLIDLIHSHFGHANWDYPRDSLHALKKLGTPKALDLLNRIVAFWWPELHKGQRAYVEKHFPEAIPNIA